MKKFYWFAIILAFASSCKQEKKSFVRIYFATYNRSLHNLPADFTGQPPISVNNFVEIRSDGTVISSNQNSQEDSTIYFYKSQLSENFLDSLNDLAVRYVNDQSFLDQDPNGIVDGYYPQCLLIETRNKNVLIEFFDSHSIPDDLSPIVSDFQKLTHEKYSTEMNFHQFYSFQKKLDGILLKRSKLLPPPIKTIIKFVPPKVDSTKR